MHVRSRYLGSVLLLPQELQQGRGDHRALCKGKRMAYHSVSMSVGRFRASSKWDSDGEHLNPGLANDFLDAAQNRLRALVT